MALLRDILQTKTHEGIRETESISSELLAKMKQMEEEWGVEFLDVCLTSCGPSENSAQILSAQTSAKIRAAAAKKAAETLGVCPADAQGLLAAIVGTPVMTSAAMHRPPIMSQRSRTKTDDVITLTLESPPSSPEQ